MTEELVDIRPVGKWMVIIGIILIFTLIFLPIGVLLIIFGIFCLIKKKAKNGRQFFVPVREI